MEKMKKLEADLKVANEVAARLTKELEDANSKLKTKDSKDTKKTPLLGNLPKLGSGEVTESFILFLRDETKNLTSFLYFFRFRKYPELP